MEKYEMQALEESAIPTHGVHPNWCEHAEQIADFLDKAASKVPAWKVWVRPGLRAAAALLRSLVEWKCNRYAL